MGRHPWSEGGQALGPADGPPRPEEAIEEPPRSCHEREDGPDDDHLSGDAEPEAGIGQHLHRGTSSDGVLGHLLGGEDRDLRHQQVADLDQSAAGGGLVPGQGEKRPDGQRTEQHADTVEVAVGGVVGMLMGQRMRQLVSGEHTGQDEDPSFHVGEHGVNVPGPAVYDEVVRAVLTGVSPCVRIEDPDVVEAHLQLSVVVRVGDEPERDR